MSDVMNLHFWIQTPYPRIGHMKKTAPQCMSLLQKQKDTDTQSHKNYFSVFFYDM